MQVDILLIITRVNSHTTYIMDSLIGTLIDIFANTHLIYILARVSKIWLFSFHFPLLVWVSDLYHLHQLEELYNIFADFQIKYMP